MLERVFGWLLREQEISPPSPDVSEVQERQKLLRAFMAFELWRAHAEEEDGLRDALPSHLGYELLRALARTVPDSSVEAGMVLWKPVFLLGAAGHYFIETFIDRWLLEVSRRADVNALKAHWRAMLEFALASPRWNSGREWYYGEQLLCRLLGCGSEIFLDQKPDLQQTVIEMGDLESWAEQHFARDEDNIARICGFMRSKTGRLLRLSGLRWLQRALQGGVRASRWHRSSTGDAMIDFLDVTIAEDADSLTADPMARDALISLILI